MNGLFFLKKLYNGKQAHEMMSNIIEHSENKNQNHNKIHFTKSRMSILIIVILKKQETGNKCWQGCGEILIPMEFLMYVNII